MPVAENENPDFEIKRTVIGSVVTFEGTYQGKPIRVRIVGTPVEEPDTGMIENEG